MKRTGWMEVLVIGVVAAGGALLWPCFPAALPVWQSVLGLSALLLAQSLVRDVTILFRHGRATSDEPRREAQCFCLESTVGATGILAGALLAGLGSLRPVAFQRWEFFLGIVGTLVLGFLLKDWVIAWNPVGLRREKDHLNLLVRWKRNDRDKP